MRELVLLVSALLCAGPVLAKVFSRCDLVRELRCKHNIPEDQLPVWVCIAQHESNYDTSAVGPTGDHGIFQISQLYWCSPPGNGWACGVTCAELEDDDISDDVTCARRIFREHQRLSGNGFSAWSVYRPYCTGVDLSQYVRGCEGCAGVQGDDHISRNELVKRRADLRVLRRNVFLKRYLEPYY